MHEDSPYSTTDVFCAVLLMAIFGSISTILAIVLAHRMTFGKWESWQDLLGHAQLAFGAAAVFALVVGTPVFLLLMRKNISATKAGTVGGLMGLALCFAINAVTPNWGGPNALPTIAFLLIPFSILSALIIQRLIGSGSR